MMACMEKWMVFINRGAGNFPKSSPSRNLLYLIDNKDNESHVNSGHAKTIDAKYVQSRETELRMRLELTE